MLWRSLHGDLAAIRAGLHGADAAEIRLDLSTLSLDDIVALFTTPDVPLLVTHHGDGGREVLAAAIRAGATLVDLPLGGGGLDAELVELARLHGCRVVASFHDHEGTPSHPDLETLVDRGFAAGADIVKVACLVRQPREAARLIGLLDDARPVVALGMGDDGRITRLAGAELGSPLAFVAADAGPTAPGQLTEARLRELTTLLHEGQA